MHSVDKSIYHYQLNTLIFFNAFSFLKTCTSAKKCIVYMHVQYVKHYFIGFYGDTGKFTQK